MKLLFWRLAWLGLCQVVLNFPLPSINYTDFEAYPVPDHCPLDQTTWEEASVLLNCSSSSRRNRYHCLPNKNKTMLLQFCYPYKRIRMSPGFCFVVADNGRITNENCSSFLDNQCQMSYDDISSIYKYPACLSINPKHGCYTSDPDCPDPVEIDSTEASETTTVNAVTTKIPSTARTDVENQGHPAEDGNTASISIAIVIPVLVVVVITSVLIYCFCYKRKRDKARNTSNQSPEEIGLLETAETPRLIDGAVTFDINKNGIKLCVSLPNGSLPISSITWKKNDSMIEIDINTRKYSRGESGQHRYLIIHDVNHDDRGQYSCFVTSETGKESETVVFNLDAVNVELDFISSILLGEIRCARLTATFTSSEILEMMWLKRDGNTTKSIKVDNEKYSESTYLSRQEMHLFIHDVNESDAGSYWVIVKTTSGIGISRPGTLDVLHETPRLNDGGVTVDINKNGIKLCVSLSNGSLPISSITWKKNDSMIEIDINTRKYSRGESGQHRYLIIHDVNHDDRGQYSCFVTSETGKESETVVFNLDAVNVELDFISSIPVGEIRCARLTATFTSSEILEMMWLKRDGNTTKSIKVDNEKYSETTYSSRQEMHLFIHDVNESDAGSYWVIVKTTSGIGISRPGTLDVLHDNKESLYKEWEKENDHFVSWSASRRVIESLQNNNIVIITGEQGSGKSAIIHNVALDLKSRSCKIVFVSHLKDIIACWQSEDNEVYYIIEDPFGKTVLDISKLFQYLSIVPRIQNSKQVKLLMAVSLPVYKKIYQIERIASCIDTVNLSCEQYDEEEKEKIFQLTGEVPADLQKQMAAKENFPFLCYLYANEGFECQNDEGTNFTAEYEKHIAEKISRNHRDVFPNILTWMVLCIFNNNVLNSISFQNAAIVEWMGKNANGQLREAFDSLGSTRTYLERSMYGDSVFTLKRDKVLEVVVGLLKQMDKGLSQLRRIPPMFFGLFLRKLELPNSVDIFFNVNCVNLCEIFESDDMVYFLEQIPLTGDIPIDDLKRVFLSESVYDIVNAWGSDPCGEVDLSRQNVELYGYTLLFSFTLTHNNMRKILKTKVLWWVAKFGSIQLLKNILDIINSDEFSEELKRLLELSCFSNSKDKPELILERRKRYGTPDEDRIIFEVPVKIAFFRKSETVLGFLNEKGAKLDDIEIDGKTLLSASIHDRQEDGEVDDLQFTKFLAKKMEDINKVDRNGETALLIATEKGDNELVKMFLRRKANVNKCGPRNRTPLFIAAEKDRYQILKELLQHHARIDSYDANGRSSLHEAARRGHIKIVKHLVNRGANVNKPDIDKKTPLHLAVEENRYKVAEFLVSKNSNIDSLDKLRQSPLYIAAKLGLDQMLELLINEGGDVNNKDGETPLHVAAHLKNAKIVKQLLEGKAKVNMKDKDSNLALHLATRAGKLDIVKLLLKKNADVNVVNNQEESPLLLACSNGNYDIVKELVKSGASVNIRNIKYYTSLHAASEKNLTEIVEYLVTKGATINANDKTNKTPLYCACERGNTDVIRYLLKNGANVHLCDKHNITPLILVSKTGQLENVKLIVEHLDDPTQINRCDNESKSALHHACSEHSQDVVKYLKENHADLTLRDARGYTPVDIARENDFDDLVDILST